MKYIEKTPNSEQLKYANIIKKLDPLVRPESIVVRVPDTAEATAQYEATLAAAPNNFERKKVERNFQLEQMVWQHLVQVQFELISVDFEFPIYFELIPVTSPAGTILESTINTVVNTSMQPEFLGRIFEPAPLRQIWVYVIARSLRLKDPLEGNFDLERYKNGEFSIAQLISELKFKVGPKFIEITAYREHPVPFDQDPEKDLIEPIIMDKEVINGLADLKYRSENKFKPIDLPKNNLKVDFIQTECVGCILPTPEKHEFLQFGDFQVPIKGSLFPTVKRIVAIMNKVARL
jgi:hypothetical protein